MKESNYVSKLLIASAVLVVGISAIAGATPPGNDEGETVVRVSHADLNLSNQAGLTVLYKRLQGASSAACGPRHSLRAAGSLQHLKNNKQCYDDILSRLVAKVDNEKLNEIHEG